MKLKHFSYLPSSNKHFTTQYNYFYVLFGLTRQNKIKIIFIGTHLRRNSIIANIFSVFNDKYIIYF